MSKVGTCANLIAAGVTTAIAAAAYLGNDLVANVTPDKAAGCVYGYTPEGAVFECVHGTENEVWALTKIAEGAGFLAGKMDGSNVSTFYVTLPGAVRTGGLGIAVLGGLVALQCLHSAFSAKPQEKV